MEKKSFEIICKFLRSRNIEPAALSCGRKVVGACPSGNPQNQLVDTKGEGSHQAEGVLSGVVNL